MAPIIITIFSDDTVRLGGEDSARVLDGDYPIRVKSKVLATIREFIAQPGAESVVGFRGHVVFHVEPEQDFDLFHGFHLFSSKDPGPKTRILS